VQLEPHFSKRLDLRVRLAKNDQEIAIAQRLRYSVFHEELGARAPQAKQTAKLDIDHYDAYCDHLLVTRRRCQDSNTELCIANEEVVGTYRLLSQFMAQKAGGFYSQSEFDIAALKTCKSHLNFLELGRSCVLAPYRGTPVIELLWQGIWDYVRLHKIDVMFGCASFEGTDPARHAEALSFLAHQVGAPEDWRVAAHTDRRVKMEQLAPASYDQRRTMLGLPPLIKGYLRLGSYVGDGAVVDYAFNTTDVLVILPIANIKPRYVAHFGAPTN
jgi:L-ornithine Nalpha-acyltransferase